MKAANSRPPAPQSLISAPAFPGHKRDNKTVREQRLARAQRRPRIPKILPQLGGATHPRRTQTHHRDIHAHVHGLAHEKPRLLHRHPQRDHKTLQKRFARLAVRPLAADIFEVGNGLAELHAQ